MSAASLLARRACTLLDEILVADCDSFEDLVKQGARQAGTLDLHVSLPYASHQYKHRSHPIHHSLLITSPSTRNLVVLTVPALRQIGTYKLEVPGSHKKAGEYTCAKKLQVASIWQLCRHCPWAQVNKLPE